MGHRKRGRRSRARFSTSQWIAVVAVAVLGVGAISLGAAALGRDAPAVRSAGSPAPVATYGAGTSAADTFVVASFDTATEKLRAAQEPFTLTVVGDSTGYPTQGWVEWMAQDISEASDRLVIVHPWNMETGTYDVAHTYGTREPALTIWNGSAPGQSPTYSMDNLDGIMPPSSDLVIVNHGHNAAEIRTVQTLARRAAVGGPAMAVVLQNPRTNGAELQASKIEALRRMEPDMPGAAFVDVYSAFPADPTPWLSEDGVHPNNDGYRAWTDVTLARLGFAS